MSGPMASKNPDIAAYERLLAPHDKGGYGYTKTRLAEALGITKQAVTRWKAVPLKYVVPLSRKTGIDKADLLPSVFA